VRSRTPNGAVPYPKRCGPVPQTVRSRTPNGAVVARSSSSDSRQHCSNPIGPHRQHDLCCRFRPPSRPPSRGGRPPPRPGSGSVDQDDNSGSARSAGSAGGLGPGSTDVRPGARRRKRTAPASAHATRERSSQARGGSPLPAARRRWSSCSAARRSVSALVKSKLDSGTETVRSGDRNRAIGGRPMLSAPAVPSHQSVRSVSPARRPDLRADPGAGRFPASGGGGGRRAVRVRPRISRVAAQRGVVVPRVPRARRAGGSIGPGTACPGYTPRAQPRSRSAVCGR